jgi:hypothetical protein
VYQYLYIFPDMPSTADALRVKIALAKKGNWTLAPGLKSSSCERTRIIEVNSVGRLNIDLMAVTIGRRDVE